jgi:hypothetical protein
VPTLMVEPGVLVDLGVPLEELRGQSELTPVTKQRLEALLASRGFDVSATVRVTELATGSFLFVQP